uniref:Hemolymph juvenile hormone binding protein n=1 Tax=Stomoxys calcitrans TaxID=35570 RepID=A0A1I8PEW6_STOCA
MGFEERIAHQLLCRPSPQTFAVASIRPCHVMDGRRGTEPIEADFLHPCSVTDPNFSSCFSKIVESIHTEWKNGVPGLKSVSSFDPLHVRRIAISQDVSNPISINLSLHNVTLTGISGAKVTESKFVRSPLGLMIKLAMPKLIVEGGYDINGHILTLPVGGQGKASISVDKSIANVAMLLQKREDRGFTFTTVDDLRLDLQQVSGVHLNLEDSDASQENAILNTYGDAIFEILRPSLNAALSKLFKDRWAKIFAYVPAEYVFADLPNTTK